MDWKELLKSATIMDDAFMNLVFKYKPELFIKIVKEVFKVVGIREYNIDPSSIKIQEKLPNIHSKEATLDVAGKTYDGDLVGLELQVKLSDFPYQRGNYYSAAMEVSLLKKGMEYKELPNHYLIVFCKGDIIKHGVPISDVRKINTITNKYVDNSREIYIDMSNPNLEIVSEDIFNLSKDLSENDPDKIIDDEIRDVIKYFKESEEGMQQASTSYQKAVEKLKEKLEEKLEEKYRKRAEAEVAALKKENAELKSIIEQQSKILKEFENKSSEN